jgi:hypothetical protein
MATFPIAIPIFFGQKTFEGSIHDADFKDNMEEICPIHLKWAKLVKEHITQQENNGNDVSSIIKHLTKKPSSKKVDNATYVTVGTTEAYFPESVFFSSFLKITKRSGNSIRISYAISLLGILVRPEIPNLPL